MTISNLTVLVSYNGNGSTKDFAITPDFYQNSELILTLRDVAGSETVQTENTDFTFNAVPATSAHLLVAPAAGEQLVIYRVTPLTQQLDLNPDSVLDVTAVERELDKITRQIQEVQYELRRTPKFKVTSTCYLDSAFPDFCEGDLLQWCCGTFQRAEDFPRVDSVNCRCGDVILTSADVGLQNVLNCCQLRAACNLGDLPSASTARTNLGLGSAALCAVSAFMQASCNLSDLSNCATARTNLGLGSAATCAASSFVQSACNLSDLASCVTARTNLGLGTIAVCGSADYAKVASNLSDLASCVTARTNLGLGTSSVCNTSAFLWPSCNLSDVGSVGTSRTNLGLGTSAVCNTSGFLWPSNNLSDVTSVSTSRTNLGLGTSAVCNTSGFLWPSNNLSDVTSVSTSRTNLGLGTIALCAATDYAKVASNLSDLASCVTARTNLGLGTSAVCNNSAFLWPSCNLSDVASVSTSRTNLGLGTSAVCNTAGFLWPGCNLSDVSSVSTSRTNLGLGTSAVCNTSGFLWPTCNLSDVSSASTSRTNLGLGTSAVCNTSGFLWPICNLSDVSSASTSRTNLGLGTAAVCNTTGFLWPTCNLSDVGSVSTSRTNLGLGSIAVCSSGSFALNQLFTGDSGSGGACGIVPAPAAGDAAASKFLKADGNWAVPSGTGVGTVTCVCFAVSPTWLCNNGSPISSAGAICLFAAGGQTANLVVASPNGATGAVALRALVGVDLPLENLTESSTYAVLAADKAKVIYLNSTGGAFNLNLPSPTSGFYFFAKDCGGLMDINNVTLHRNASESIESLAADYAFKSAYGHWKVWADGTNWWVD